MSDTDLLDRVFAKQSPSGAWKMLRDWFLPRSIATQVKWSDAFDAVKMENGEEPMKFFSRVDKIVGTLSSLGVQKSVGDVNRELERVLTNDYEMEQRTLLHRDDVSREDIESIVRKGTWDFPSQREGTWARHCFRMVLPKVAADVGVEVVAETTVTMVIHETEEGQRLLTPTRIG